MWRITAIQRHPYLENRQLHMQDVAANGIIDEDMYLLLLFSKSDYIVQICLPSLHGRCDSSTSTTSCTSVCFLCIIFSIPSILACFLMGSMAPNTSSASCRPRLRLELTESADVDISLDFSLTSCSSALILSFRVFRDAFSFACSAFQ